MSDAVSGRRPHIAIGPQMDHRTQEPATVADWRGRHVVRRALNRRELPPWKRWQNTGGAVILRSWTASRPTRSSRDRGVPAGLRRWRLVSRL